ncbi:hypothetical protein BKA64DRAFT_688111 [Cadophora sp. MPI-SDFR-AT-0126]|nr:hypothetical protein BKA64DRAFT_688111 [Leotiomycetes sp. MPI-SDFR-AT-0126]
MQNKSRRTHRKSRNGCGSCKKRKTKCDEAQPSCFYCTKHGIDCQYPTTLGSLAPRHTAESNVSTPQPQSASTILSNPGIPPSVPPGLNWRTRDLELLHFYTTSTCFTISNLPHSQQLWQQAVPQLAFSHPILLRSLLAVSALHLARSSPDREHEFRLEASEHHGFAVQEFRAAISQVTEENCHATFACAVFIFIYAWASSHSKCTVFLNSEPRADDDGPAGEWVKLLRGATGPIGISYDIMLGGPLGRLFFLWDVDADALFDLNSCAEDVSKLDALAQLWIPRPDTLSVNETNALDETLSLLRETYVAMSIAGDRVDKVSACLSWPIRASDLYLDLVAKQSPQALVLLAHYSLLLNMCGDLWWLQGMSRKLLQEVHRALSEKWRHWIQWPLHELVTSEFRYQS